MKKVFKKGICLFLALLMLTSGISVFASDSTATQSSPRVFIIGDSTACSYGSDSERTGWGEALQNFLTDPKMIVNAASAGESSHSFYDKEWHWNTVKARLKKGDYLLIQFGHNDCPEGENTDYSYYSDPELPITEHNPESGQYSYKWYLKQYIDAALEAGAYPILVTSVERKTHLTSSASPLAPYVDAMKALATEEVPVIDVWTEFRTNAETAAESWYVSDGVHLAEKGAIEVARIFANGIKASSVASAQSLAGYLVDNVDAVTTHTDILGINENFEDYTLPVEGNVGVGSPLEPTTSNVTEEKYAYIVAENESNNVVKLATTGGAHTVSYEFPRALSTGYYKLKYRFKSNGNTTDMQFVTTIGKYPANTRYAKNSINKSGGDNLKTYGIFLTDGEWLEVEYYMDPANAKLDILCEGNHLGSWAKAGQLDNLEIISIGFPSSGAGTNAELYLDDIDFGEISEEDYNLALGVMPEVTLPAGITAQENFEQYSVPGTTIGTTLWGWSSYNTDANTPITYETEPGDSTNKVARFESKLNRTSTHRTLKYDLPTVLEDGVYSVKFRLRSGDNDSNTFWLSILDTQTSKNRHYIAFRLFGDEVAMNSRSDGEDVTVSAEYDFNLTDWFDIEVVYDLTAVDAAYATVYVNETKVLNNVLVGGATSELNNGTIKSVQFQISNAYNATQISSTGTAEDGVFAAFLLDDIVIKQTSIVTGVTVDKGKLTGISAYFDAVPSAVSPKFIAAVYDGATLKDVAFSNDTATAGSQSVNLSKSLSVASGNTVKVYYWDMTKLIPCIKMFETVIQ